MQMQSSSAGRHVRFASAVALALSVVSCHPATTEAGAGTVTARVDRARGTVLITNSRSERVLVGIIGRAMAAVALRAPCGRVQVGPQRTATFDIPSGETGAIVFYCVLPLPANGGTTPEQTFLVSLEN